ncbi:hypothetical protein FCIRC_11798 [Fusarium circinatum]|uniref:DUF7587 domain-containing protein n=1 Tax=Fusarium circinatum TaxID=48490 RepID=A0A8H5T1V0_FUSCI|nr:hypothetical protein FCIRC_11798 [Fusarium circinatum]
MGTKCEDAINIRINALRIVDDSPVSPRSELQDAISDFNQAVASAQLRGQRLVALLNDPDVVYKASEDELFKVRANVNRITKSAQSVTGTIDRSLVEIITSRTGPRGRRVDELLEFFSSQINDIARGELDNVDNGRESEGRVIEKCCIQAMRPSGTLDPSQYFAALSTEDPLWSCRPQFLGFRDLEGGRVASRYLSPDQSTSLQWPFQDVPRYLFRVYDSKSSGFNSDTVFASEHSSAQYGAPGRKLNILSLDDRSASGMLYNHLERKDCFNGSGSFNDGRKEDNLVSWTSSLMNAIQYAIWRSHVGHTPASNVYICAVDTRKFPQGQFARDMWLLETYAHPKSNWFRLENPEYDNGEYLSQGVIHHGGRSSVFSLRDLVSAGLYELYPEFAEPSAKDSWTNRVLELRVNWTEECRISDKRFDHACEIARGLLHEIDIWDAILLLLTFKKHHSTNWYNLWDASDMHSREPDEVRRFKALLKYTEDRVNSTLAQLNDLSEEEARKVAHLQNLALIKGILVMSEDIANGINDLNISGRRFRTQPRKSLNDAVHNFDETAVALSEQAATIAPLLCTENALKRGDAESICLVYNRGLQLARDSRLLIDSATPALVRQVICLDAQKSFAVDDLLEHFKKPIETITQRVIGTSGSEDILRKIAEECYHQAASPTGELNPDDYLATSKLVESKDQGENWNKFWARSLCNCPGGPTLFQPKEDSVCEDSATKPPKHMPRYLFRAYDDRSTGRNDEDIIASVLSKYDKANRQKIDIFSMDYQVASEMLHQHLVKDLFSGRGTDNLVSWSSSLMFVIQYANYRSCIGRSDRQDSVYICAVDTEKFPRGQFAQSKWLLQSFRNAQFTRGETRYRNLRLNRTEYDNGEYLSQGVVHLGGRSFTFSLQALTDAGLWDLYPAFNIRDAEPTAPVRISWSNYVLSLRESWNFGKETTRQEIDCAATIAKECFPDFNAYNITVLLLAFRQRKLSTGLLRTTIDEPVEVHRYVLLKLFEQLYKLQDT